jgi:kynurenine formamidase
VLKDGVLTRGVLFDMPRLKNVPYLEPGTPLFIDDLEAWEQRTGVRVEAGDALFIRTGRWARRAQVGPWNVAERAAGVHSSVAPWFKARGVAFAGSDAALDVTPSLVEGVNLTVHSLFITAMGIHLLDNQDLDALADTAARLKRWEFMVTIAPMVVRGGTGSPVNVVATF